MKYIVTYKIPVENKEKRYFALSSVDKADYICRCLNRCGEKVEIISTSESLINESYHERRDIVNENLTVITSPTPRGGSLIRDKWATLYTQIWLLFYLIKNCKKGERIFVYHKVMNVPTLIIAIYIKRLKVVLEVEEIFSQLNTSKWREKLEWQIFSKADSYIFASFQLQEIINKKNKPYVIANGKYEVAPIIAQPSNDGKIHLVYAGLIADGKVAFKSAGMAQFLSDKYHIHIIGYGQDEDINKLKDYISDLTELGKAGVTYDGLKRGKDYDCFLQSCHFGLCPISSDKKFQNACFPSKVTSYLANGLKVVVTENEVIRSSAYGTIVIFSKDDSSFEMAKAVTLANKDASMDIRTLIKQLDFDFVKALKDKILK